MIYINDKKIMLFPEHRVIGSAGDNSTREIKFCLSKIQDGYDLSNMVAFIKITPVSPSEQSYNQLLNKKIEGDNIILSWLLTDENLKSEGKLTVQIEFAASNFFFEEDLKNLSGDSLVVPSFIEGVSAPVWQSYKECFFVADSIDIKEGYTSMTKDILTAAVAAAVAAKDDAELAQLLSEDARDVALAAVEDIDGKLILAQNAVDSSQAHSQSSKGYANEAKNNALAAEGFSNSADISALSAKDSADIAAMHSKDASENSQNSYNSATQAAVHMQGAKEYLDQTIETYNSTCEVYNDTVKLSEEIALAGGERYRLAYSHTLTAEEDGTSVIEIVTDSDGNELSFKKFVMYLKTTPIPEATSPLINLYLQAVGDYNSLGNRRYAKCGTIEVLDSASNVETRIEGELRGRWVLETLKGKNLVNNQLYTKQSIPYSSVRQTDNKNVCAIRLQPVTSGASFKEGTQIELWIV